MPNRVTVCFGGDPIPGASWNPRSARHAACSPKCRLEGPSLSRCYVAESAKADVRVRTLRAPVRRHDLIFSVRCQSSRARVAPARLSRNNEARDLRAAGQQAVADEIDEISFVRSARTAVKRIVKSLRATEPRGLVSDRGRPQRRLVVRVILISAISTTSVVALTKHRCAAALSINAAGARSAPAATKALTAPARR